MEQEKPKKKYLPLILKVSCALVCLYIIFNILFFDTYSLYSYLHQKNELYKLTETNEKLMTNNSELETEIDKLKNDPFHIETIARKYYSMIKRGETVFLFREKN